MKDVKIVFVICFVALLSVGCGTGERLEKLISALDTATISLEDAIRTAQDEVPDGVVVEAELEVEDGDPFYEVEVLVGNLVKEVSIDPVSGEVLSVEDEVEDEKVDAPCDGSISLIEAVRKGEEHGNGSAIEVELEGCEFEVQVVKGDELWEVEIGPDGDFLEKESSDEDDEDDDGDLDDEDDDEDGDDD